MHAGDADHVRDADVISSGDTGDIGLGSLSAVCFDDVTCFREYWTRRVGHDGRLVRDPSAMTGEMVSCRIVVGRICTLWCAFVYSLTLIVPWVTVRTLFYPIPSCLPHSQVHCRFPSFFILLHHRRIFPISPEVVFLLLHSSFETPERFLPEFTVILKLPLRFFLQFSARKTSTTFLDSLRPKAFPSPVRVGSCQPAWDTKTTCAHAHPRSLTFY